MLEQGRKQQLIFLYVIDLEVGGSIKNLDTVVVGSMEQLTRDVGRVSYIAAGRMPVGIDTEAKRLIGLGVIGFEGTTTVAQQCGTMRPTFGCSTSLQEKAAS